MLSYVGQIVHWWPGRDAYNNVRPEPFAAVVLRIERLGEARRLTLRVLNPDGPDIPVRSLEPIPAVERDGRVEIATFIEK